jgi:hypothetical protein
MSSSGLIRKEQIKNTTQMYRGMQWVMLQTPLTSTAWDGDAKTTADNGIIDLSSVFGAPAGVKAIIARLSVQDETLGTYAQLSPVNGAIQGAVITRIDHASSYVDASGVCPCDANGDIYISFSDEVDNCYLYIWGYLI